ncbi:hypothetical protein HDZ31DRAFT_63996 [Schizophyllum fasciatum]
MEIDPAQFLAAPPPYEEVAPHRSMPIPGSPPPYQESSPRLTTMRNAILSRPMSAQRRTVAVRLPAYRHTGYGRFRTHPYRRPLEYNFPVIVEDDDMMRELESITIMDVISTPEYLSAASYPEQLYPVLTTNPVDWNNLTREERAQRLSERIADIDGILADVNVYTLNEVENRVIDFALFVRRNLAARREAELFTGNTLF